VELLFCEDVATYV